MNDQAATQHIDEFDISGLEAMLAGTLCLMSAYAHRASEPASHRDLLSLKIVSNLSCLQCQSSLSPEFRRVLSKVCETWRQQALASEASSVLPWQAAPATIH
jgi:hypothetical protein